MWSDSGAVRVRVGHRSKGGVHRRKRGMAADTAPEGAPGQPSQPRPQRPYAGRTHIRVPRDAKLVAESNNGRCVRCSMGIPIQDVEALHPSAGDWSQHPALQG